MLRGKMCILLCCFRELLRVVWLSGLPACRDIETSHHALSKLSCHIWPPLPAACRLVQHNWSLQCSLTCFCHLFSGVCDCSHWPCLKRKYFYLPPAGPVWRHGVIHDLRSKQQWKVKGEDPFFFVVICSRKNRTPLLAKLMKAFRILRNVICKTMITKTYCELPRKYGIYWFLLSVHSSSRLQPYYLFSSLFSPCL